MMTDTHDELRNVETRSAFTRGTRKGTWNRALVLDTESGFVDIQRESDVDGSKCPVPEKGICADEMFRQANIRS